MSTVMTEETQEVDTGAALRENLFAGDLLQLPPPELGRALFRRRKLEQVPGEQVLAQGGSRVYFLGLFGHDGAHHLECRLPAPMRRGCRSRIFRVPDEYTPRAVRVQGSGFR